MVFMNGVLKDGSGYCAFHELFFAVKMLNFSVKTIGASVLLVFYSFFFW